MLLRISANLVMYGNYEINSVALFELQTPDGQEIFSDKTLPRSDIITFYV